VALAIEQIPQLAATILQQSGVPGMCVAVVYDDEVVYSGGFGVRELGKDEAVDAETVFMLASVSKPVSATIVASVVADGGISWNSTMADVAPGFALHDAWTTQNVTLADLFSHRSGLKDHGGDVLEDLGFARDEIIYRLRYLEPEYAFRDGYAYTNFGLTAAAVAAAESVGMTWEDLAEERLYAPLGMTHTSSRLADYLAEANRAVPHVKEGGAWIVAPVQRDPDPQSPAGGAYSNAVELAQWLRLQLGEGNYDGQQLIPTEALNPMHRPQAFSRIPANLAQERAGFYGLGLNVSYTDYGKVQWGHSGAFAMGAATAVFMFPSSGFGVLALTNGEPVGASEAICLSVMDLVTTGAVTRDWLELGAARFAAAAEEGYSAIDDWDTPPANAMPTLADEAYAGTYRNDFYGDVEIVASEDGLVMRIGPAPLEFPLQPYDRDSFSWMPPGENASGRSGLTFVIGPEGVATAFTDEYMMAFGPGLLSRTA
jgi:CubicO group peptidase (beta-lactamase class C family)